MMQSFKAARDFLFGHRTEEVAPGQDVSCHPVN
jgi:hypothetical protein